MSEKETSGTVLSSTIINTPFPIKELVIHSGKKTYTYKPRKDITSYELARLIVMFPFFTIANYQGYDFAEYILREKLERHFEVNDV